jgi:hypothetical protein
MTLSLSPEARGTLAALRQRQRLRFFSPESADELIAAGFARKEQDDLAITQIGVKAAKRVYAKLETTSG